ncbi:hypothetical protein COLO4_02732 [Corchorus olitorius]|uniref:Uncharacterized protein n=1 Tax=Corchorus olitorius TaxID=93759 RepID=A0A1R3L0F9_9ROSI|nr:hypothetical protein COLO4_02732 [Corchorus olitorius]
MGTSEVAAEGNGEENLYQIEIRMQSWPTTNLVNRILSPILR